MNLKLQACSCAETKDGHALQGEVNYLRLFKGLGLSADSMTHIRYHSVVVAALHCLKVFWAGAYKVIMIHGLRREEKTKIHPAILLYLTILLYIIQLCVMVTVCSRWSDGTSSWLLQTSD